MRITQEDFDKRLVEIAEENWKIKALLRDCDGYEGFPEHLKPQLHKLMGVKVVNKTKYFTSQ